MKTRKLKKAEEGITPKFFEEMVKDHDPTYLWSKNSNYIENERAKEKEIMKARMILGDEICVPIWNALMRTKVVPSFVQEYLWRKNEHT